MFWAFVMESYCGFIKKGARSKVEPDLSLTNWIIRLEHLNHIPSLMRKTEGEDSMELLTPYKHHQASTPYIAAMLRNTFGAENTDPFKRLICYKRCRLADHTTIGSIASQQDQDNTRNSSYMAFRDSATTPLQYAQVTRFADLGADYGQGAIVKCFQNFKVDGDIGTVLFQWSVRTASLRGVSMGIFASDYGRCRKSEAYMDNRRT